MANEPVNCKDCGERLLLKNMPAHVHKAMLHVKGKRKKGG